MERSNSDEITFVQSKTNPRIVMLKATISLALCLTLGLPLRGQANPRVQVSIFE
jgi:hypothetical protein